MKAFKSILAFQQHFDTDAKCRLHLEQSRWNGSPRCPFCDSTNVHKHPSGKKFNCKEKECRKIFSHTTGTIYENTKIPLTKWYLATYILINHSKGISSLQLAGWLDVTQRTAWFLNHRIREMLKETNPQLLANEVEADETFIGGKEGNKHNRLRAARQIRNEKKKAKEKGLPFVGRGPFSDKTMVAGMLERGGKVITKVIPDVKGSTLKLFVRWNVVKGATVYTDEYRGYKGLSQLYNHESVSHGLGEYVRGKVHVNNIEGYWNILKKQIVGIHHSVSAHHLQRYCDESAYRFNHRTLTQDEKFENVIKRCNGRLKYNDLIGKLEA